MKEPKFLLVMENHPTAPYAIYEQSEITMESKKEIGQRLYLRFTHLDIALKNMVELNEGQPVLLAYSTKPIDNSFKI